MLALGPVLNSAGDLGCVEFYPGFSVGSQAIKETFHHALCLQIDTKNYRSELVRLKTRYRRVICENMCPLCPWANHEFRFSFIPRDFVDPTV